jgi:lipid kinase YegS
MQKRKQLLFVIHGARSEHPGVRHLVQWVREKGHTVIPRITWERGDATFFAAEGAKKGVDVVVALGGDGTVNEAVNGLSGFDVPLGIVPLGTANDFARQAGIPFDLDHAMDVILRSEPVRIDTAELNGHRFLNVSTAGIGAEATAETPADAKEALGSLAYAITGVRKLIDLSPIRARIETPNSHTDVEFLVLAVGNARETGGGTIVTPRASVTDGLLDVCIVDPMPRRDFARLALRVRDGEHLHADGVRYFQVPWLRVSAERAITVNVDGEPRETTTLDYRSRPGDLLVHVARVPGTAAPADEVPGGFGRAPNAERRQPT